ncbi:NAD-dependent epimerase/dehydratase family protein [candidate division KSB1 bacterium]|nr:NAD-dependent epimerase/dehydratase family protein [candidate division KSB1 bacterium]
MRRRALITGGTGFVGSHTIESYLRAGWIVRALVRDPNRLSWLRALPVEFATGDVANVESLRAAVAECETVVHCAGLTKAVHEVDLFRVNVRGVAEFTKVARDAGCKRFVLCSSQAAAGPSTGAGAKREDEPPTPISAYGRSKLEGEREIVANAGEMEWVILRPSAVIGPRDLQFVPLFRAIKAFGLYPRWGSGSQRYSLIYVKDLARALLLAGESDRGLKAVYFAAARDSVTWSDVSFRLARIAGRRVRALPIPRPVIHAAAPISELVCRLTGKPALLSRDKLREILADGWVCDASAIERAWGFRCEYELDALLRETYESYVADDLI